MTNCRAQKQASFQATRAQSGGLVCCNKDFGFYASPDASKMELWLMLGLHRRCGRLCILLGFGVPCSMCAMPSPQYSLNCLSQFKQPQFCALTTNWDTVCHGTDM